MESEIAWMVKYLDNKIGKKIAQRSNRELPYTVQKVINALWDNENVRPLINKETKTQNGWDLNITFPIGVKHKDLIEKLDYFKDATGIKNIECKNNPKSVVLQFIEKDLDGTYDFEWDFNRKGGRLVVPLGYSLTGLETFALEKVPHVLIAGETNGGKSNTIHCWISALLTSEHPPFIFGIDMKKSEFAYLKNHIGLVIDEIMAEKLLIALRAEMQRRQMLFYENCTVDIGVYNRKFKNDPLPYVVIFIDELSQIQRKKSLQCIFDLLSLARNVGFCLVVATQRPSSTLLARKSMTDLKANLTGRLAFGCVDETNSRMIIGNDMAAGIGEVNGRAIWKFGSKLIKIQTPYMDMNDPDAVLDRINRVPQMKKVVTKIDLLGEGQKRKGQR